MKSAFKKLILTVLCFVCVLFSVHSNDTLNNLQKNVSAFSDTMAKSLPFNSSIGLNWSDAYIGKFLGVPPHFGVGITAGMTTIDLPAINNITNMFDISLPTPNIRMLNDKIVFPAFALEGRLGGFFLPFDIGVKFGTLPPIKWGVPFDIRYTMAGADIRFALLDGKSNIFLPNLSIGLGVNYLNGGIGAKIGSGSFIFNLDGGGGNGITVSNPDVNLTWNTFGIDFKAQISKQILIITPYAGIAGGYSWSKAGYEIKTDVTFSGGANKDTVNNALIAAGLDTIDFDDGISSIVERRAWNARLFGGASINIFLFKIDLTGMYNFTDGQIGASLGFRFQL